MRLAPTSPIVGLVLGMAACVRPLRVHSALVLREFPILLTAVLIGWVLLSNGRIDRWDGVLLLAGFGVALSWMMSMALRDRAKGLVSVVECKAESSRSMSNTIATFWLIAGIGLLLASSQLLVYAAVDIAETLGVSDLAIGFSVVAIGTSLAELAASLMAASKRADEIAVGTILGSNTFNTLVVLGLPGVIAPGRFAPEVLTRDVPIMVLLTVAPFAIAYSLGAGRINRVVGLLLLGSFFTYQFSVFNGALK